MQGKLAPVQRLRGRYATKHNIEPVLQKIGNVESQVFCGNCDGKGVVVFAGTGFMNRCGKCNGEGVLS